MPRAIRHQTVRAGKVALLVAANVLSFEAAQARDSSQAASVRVASTAAICPAHQDMFRALKLTRRRGSIRVDYQFIAGNELRWANMNAALVRRLRVRVGETFCMTRDTGSAETAATDFD